MLNPNDEHLKEEVKKFRALMGKLLEKIQNSYTKESDYGSADEISQESDEEPPIRKKVEELKPLERKNSSTPSTNKRKG